jgi:hypothetical protein
MNLPRSRSLAWLATSILVASGVACGDSGGDAITKGDGNNDGGPGGQGVDGGVNGPVGNNPDGGDASQPVGSSPFCSSELLRLTTLGVVREGVIAENKLFIAEDFNDDWGTNSKPPGLAIFEAGAKEATRRIDAGIRNDYMIDPSVPRGGAVWSVLADGGNIYWLTGLADSPNFRIRSIPAATALTADPTTFATFEPPAGETLTGITVGYEQLGRKLIIDGNDFVSYIYMKSNAQPYGHFIAFRTPRAGGPTTSSAVQGLTPFRRWVADGPAYRYQLHGASDTRYATATPKAGGTSLVLAGQEVLSSAVQSISTSSGCVFIGSNYQTITVRALD